MMQQTRSLRFPADDALRVEQLRSAMLTGGFALRDVDHALISGTKDSEVVTLYASGRLVIQGRKPDETLSAIGVNQGVAGPASLPATGDTQPKRLHSTWIGTDESGKGDYFGPLVIAGVLFNPSTVALAARLGIRDSKKLADSTVRKLSAQIRPRLPSAIVAIGPPRYNGLHKEMGNVNAILAWGHARCIENILEANEATVAIADQFGDEAYIRSALMERGKSVRLEQRPHAEEDPAVAAASVLARAEFLRRLEVLGNELDIGLPKGASAAVVKVATEIARERGMKALGSVAKLHFKTTQRVEANL